jgi:hypothetical protein
MQCSAGESTTSTPCDTGSPTQMPWSFAIDECDDLGFAGYDDWRLPETFELAMIVDAGTNNPALDDLAFPGTLVSSYWSATEDSTNPGESFAVATAYGNVFRASQTNTNGVRCVRSALYEPGPFQVTTIESDKVVEDLANELMWEGCTRGMWGANCWYGEEVIDTWDAAMTYCEDLVYADYDDWRLPDRNELATTVDFDGSPYLYDEDYFPGNWYEYWSSTTYMPDVQNAWMLQASVAFFSSSPKNSSSCCAMRCVRGGY